MKEIKLKDGGCYQYQVDDKCIAIKAKYSNRRVWLSKDVIDWLYNEGKKKIDNKYSIEKVE